MECPQCGSKDTQRSAASHEQGVRISEGKTTGVFVSSGGTFGVGFGRHQSRSSTLAAEANAPPRRVPSRAILAFAIGLFAAFALGRLLDSYLIFIVLSVVAIAAGIYFSAPDQNDLSEERRWRDQWYCKRCGMIFHAGHNKASAPRLRSSPTSPSERFVSPVLRQRAVNTRQEYIDRVRNPVQRAARMTDRDTAGLRAIEQHAYADGSFDPEQIACDLGIVSRLASLQLISYQESSDRFLLTDHAQSPNGWWHRTFGA